MIDLVRQPKLSTNGDPQQGPNGRPMHHLLTSTSLIGKLWLWRYVILRRVCQFTILLLFFGSAHWGWTIANQPILIGNLSGSEFLGFVPLADPFAVLQIFVSQHVLASKVIIGAIIVLALYALIVGRAFCSWACPINMVTDLANWMRSRLQVKDLFRLSGNTRYFVLALTLMLSAIAGVAAFEWISPISMFYRELIFGLGMAWMAVLGIFVFDLFVLKNGWCGHLCPLGAFYALASSRTAQLKVRFIEKTCTHCGECASVCPEPQVLNLKQAGINNMITSGECTNCGRCVALCPEGSLRLDIRFLIASKHQLNPATPIRRTA